LERKGMAGKMDRRSDSTDKVKKRKGERMEYKGTGNDNANTI